MTHYEVLGVPRTADPATVRHAYLELARVHHPDLQVDSATRPPAEARMRVLNEAWSVLGDADRRRAYDRELEQKIRAMHPPGTASPDFVPYTDDDTDYVALLDATPVDGTGVPRWLQLLPPALLGIALLALCAGFVAVFAPLVALGVVCLVLAGVSFVATPAFAVLRSREHDLG